MIKDAKVKLVKGGEFDVKYNSCTEKVEIQGSLMDLAIIQRSIEFALSGEVEEPKKKAIFFIAQFDVEIMNEIERKLAEDYDVVYVPVREGESQRFEIL